ncbi:uncharacterized protein A1O9_04288 [Exophiala aquamarina CBS 119918]|uniref:Xylanolytic transcriptional activator regulatory domain-containing protein n=1 Tax=Exophiala aquamarina CBS 119918 TaxID=1182545 RepID=A0A072PH45_9EURO|nr:uncharacterized protein A1O9_04288 [Exophiala aquamarina CBS 119918]KEF59444.1 hypothetical protein A1O9_04288 [Exophiala aquamarina CBS 119918]
MAEKQPQGITPADSAGVSSREQASAHNQIFDASFFRQGSRDSGDTGLGSIQGLPTQEPLSYDQYGPAVNMPMGTIVGGTDQGNAVGGMQVSDLGMFDNPSMNAPFIEPFMEEPDWINNFTFTAATYSSVLQTALPLWPTIDWSPNSLIQAPESPKQGPDNLHRTLPTPSSGRRTDFDPSKSEGTLPLLDRVFSLVSSPQDHKEARTEPSRRSSYLTSETRTLLHRKLDKYKHIMPDKFVLPSHHALNRYVVMYFTAGARHQPFIHEPTWNSATCSLGLLMAVCAMGARYSFEIKLSRQLWTLGRTILRHEMDESDRNVGESFGHQTSSGELLENCQAMLLLTMYGTWAGDKHFLRQALAFQSALATINRDIIPEKPPPSQHLTWKSWVEYEVQKRCGNFETIWHACLLGIRTKFVTLCFVNLQCLVYNLPAVILHSEFDLELPCGEELWRAETEAIWQQRRQQDHSAAPSFQDAMRRLLDERAVSETADSGETTPDDLTYSIFASYILINGLMQYSSEQRRYARSISEAGSTISHDQAKTFERALRRWQKSWENNPKASLDPQDPHGPLAFNCTALLRIAYIRLDMDFAPYAAALRSGDPEVVARTICNQPPATRSRRSMRAALHAWHALLIPIRMGMDLVAETQVFTWSIQHFIASFECCLLLANWLDAVTVAAPSPPLSNEERWLIRLVQETLQEAGIEDDVITDIRMLSSNVLTTWARLFYANKIWGIIPLIGEALTKFADLLRIRSAHSG